MAIRRTSTPRTSPFAARAIAAYRLGRLPEAISDCTEAISANPGNAVAFYIRGLAHQDLGDTLPAGEDLRSALAMNPSIASQFQKVGVPRGASPASPPLPPR